MNEPVTNLALVAAFTSTDVGKKLFLPLSEQLGLALGDLGSIFRWYQVEVLSRVCSKWAASRNSRPLTADEFRRVMPLLQLVSQQTNDHLHERWATLLENTASGENVLPSFGHTLSQLTSEEAKFLDKLFAAVREQRDELSVHKAGRDPLSYHSLIKIYDPDIDLGINPAERKVFESSLSEGQKKNYERGTRAELLIQDLERLGLLTRTPVPQKSHWSSPWQSDTTIRFEYSLTEYALGFIAAVTTKTATSASASK